MDISGFEELNQSLNNSYASGKHNDSWSLDSNKDSLDNIKYGRKKLKEHSEKVLTLDQCINSKFKYESLCSRLTCHTNKKLSKNKMKKKVIQTDLVPITFGVFNFKRNKLRKSESKTKLRMSEKNVRKNFNG